MRKQSKKQLDNLTLGPRAGGTAVKSKVPPAECPECGRSMEGRSWHSYLGHTRLHRLAERRGTTYEQEARKFVGVGLKAQDPFPENGAWQNW